MDKLKVLIYTGLQNDFISGNHSTSESAAVVNNIINKINNFNGIILGIKVYNLETSYPNTLEYQYDNNIYCKQFETGYEVPSEIQTALDNKIHFGCSETSLMTSNEIVNKIQDLQIYHQLDYEFHIIGFNTDTRVLNTALLCRQYFANSEIYIDAECCAGTSPTAHDAALITAKSNFIHVINHPTITDIEKVQ